jgi:2-polyprenyl-3-methyl-5-hydroxy-6-metoxy-1,4-benzoquinol methylase
MSICPLCESSDLFVFLERQAVPVHQNLLMESAVAARAIPRGDLRIACCRRCGFVTNTAFRDELLQYGDGYENDQTCSPFFEQHVEGLVTRLLDAGVRQKFIVEVGCGRGYFLRRLCERGANRGVGFDPSYTGVDVVDEGRVTFVRDFYGADHTSVRPDIVVCRHVIEHVREPLALLKSIAAALVAGPGTYVAFETPTVEWILGNLVIQDFFYEHCSYFSAHSLAFAFARAGFSPRSVETVFRDQYLWMQATFDGAQTNTQPDTASTDRLVAQAARYREHETERITLLRSRLEAMRRDGPLAIWGAGAKGTTYLQLVDPNATLVDCVVDINPRKQRHFIPGTAHPIVGMDELQKRGIRNAVVMNANYIPEIHALVAQAGLDLRIHPEADS